MYKANCLNNPFSGCYSQTVNTVQFLGALFNPRDFWAKIENLDAMSISIQRERTRSDDFQPDWGHVAIHNVPSFKMRVGWVRLVGDLVSAALAGLSMLSFSQDILMGSEH